MTPKQIAQLLDIRTNTNVFNGRDVCVAFFGSYQDQLAFSELCMAEDETTLTYRHQSETADTHMQYYTTWEE